MDDILVSGVFLIWYKAHFEAGTGFRIGGRPHRLLLQAGDRDALRRRSSIPSAGPDTDHESVSGYIPVKDGTSPDERELVNGYTADNCAIRVQCCTPAHQGFLKLSFSWDA